MTVVVSVMLVSMLLLAISSPTISALGWTEPEAPGSAQWWDTDNAPAREKKWRGPRSGHGLVRQALSGRMMRGFYGSRPNYGI